MSRRPIAERLDPELAAALAALGRTEVASFDLESIPGRRAAMNAMLGVAEPVDGIELATHVVRGPDPEITLVVRTPAGAASPRPGMLWIHGGGYIMGTADQPAPRLDRWCTDVGCVVVAAEYRLAPEHPFPAPLDDCFAALAWTLEHADELGIDPHRLVIGGASAGGGLAAGLSLLARDRDVSPAPIGSLLIYPMIDDRTVFAPDGEDDPPIWNYDSNALGWRAFLGPVLGEQDPRTRDVPVYAAASRATDLEGLPPTFIGVGTIDIFCAENVQYAAALIRAGVAVELHVHAGAHHGFENHAPESAIVRRFNGEIHDWLSRMMHGAP